MKNILLLFIATAMCIAVHSQTPVPGGAISGTWGTAGSPYLIQGLTYVPDGSTLTIEAGVTVEFQGSYTMYIQGRILAVGTENDSIRFTAADPETGFRSLRFIETGAGNDTSRLEHCIFEYGNVYGDFPDNCGGAIAIIEFSKVCIKHCLFKNNRAIEPPTTENSCGGAIALWTGSPDITNCTFENNTAYSGGAIICYIDSDPLIENSTFTKNRAIEEGYAQGYGGAICAFVDSDPIIRGNTFVENNARNGGGALAFVLDCFPVIDHNLFYNDTAHWGGAIELQDNCVGHIINNTIANNHAFLWGGGIDCWTGSTANAWNTILWENTTDSIGSQVFLFEPSDLLNLFYSDIMYGQDGVEGEGSIGEWRGVIEDDPLFEDPASGNYHLTGDSPCIDTGDPDCLDPDGTPCDMGAFYYFLDDMPDKDSKKNNTFSVYPNPADNEVFVKVSSRQLVVGSWQSRQVGISASLRLAVGQNVTLTMVDLFGREVRTLVDEIKSPGEYTVRMDVSDLPPGVYLIWLQADGQRTVRKLVVQ